MKLACTLTQLFGGQWRARHVSSNLGTVEVTAQSREVVLTKLRDELQYRIELCPCSGAWGDTVELEVEQAGR
jgi:hypothetical protein